MFEKGRTRALLIASLAAAIVPAAGCGGSESSGGPTDTLTVGVTGDTESLNPAVCGPTVYCYPMYDSLIYATPDGEYKPDLASSWKFTDDKHQTLQLTLRKGVHFTDGTELTGEAVAASINAFRKSPGPLAGNAFPIDKVEAAGKYTVDIHYSVPSTYAHALGQLTKPQQVGAIVGPEGLKNSKSLETSSDGIGPYKLDGSRTTKGSVYTYVPNPKYFNQDAIRYKKIVMKPMQNPSARLSAIQSGQIDWAQGLSNADADKAEAAGLRISEGKLGRTPAGAQLLVLAQRDSGPLANLKVRQAISYAIPRDDITTAVFGGFATPSASIVAEGDEGYNPDNTNLFPYDESKAKQLLTEAGYPNGFTLKVLDASFFDPNYALGQALASALGKVGIKLDLVTSDAPPGNVTQELSTKKYPAFIWNAVGGTFSFAYFQFAPGALLNPFELPADEKLMQLITTASLASEEEQPALMQDATTRLDELAWAVPVATVTTLQATRKDVMNVPGTFITYEMDPFSPITEENWYTSNE